jgi:long-subunit fatty acid transport protein
MRSTRFLLWLAALCAVLPASLAAQDLTFGIRLPDSLNFATSPSPVGSGARAQGKAIAFIGVADDATAASHNPGGLVQLERPEVSIVGSYFARLERQDVTVPETVVEDQNLDNFALNYLSIAYPFQLFRRNIVVSVNYQRLFDLQSATDVTSRFTTLDGVQQVHSRQRGALFTISPAIAVQITPTVSVGAAFNIWPDLFGNGYTQDVEVRGTGLVVSGNRIVPFTSTGDIREEVDFHGFNITAGFLWTINPIFQLGGVFRSAFTGKAERQHRSSLTVQLQDGTDPVSTGLDFRETLDFELPMSYGLGLSARLSDALTVSLDVSRTHWSDLELEESEQDDVLLVENGAPSGKGQAVLRGEGDDTTSVRLGAEYLWIRSRLVIPFRGGLFYDPEPGDGGTDHFFGFSVGSGVAWKQFIFDLAYTFRTGTVESEATDTDVYQHTLLASIIYHF